jgi:Tfp pilus assembly protein PilV
VEVLVAAVLLAIGIAGTMSAVATSVRFRGMALTREMMASAGQARLSWFEASACVGADTAFASSPAARIHEHWEVRRTATGALLDGTLSAGPTGRALSWPVNSSIPCP